MKVLFICGSLEPGKDGIGDYTAMLAFELIRQHNYIHVISLYDKHKSSLSCENRISDGITLKVSRLPVSASHDQRLTAIKDIVDDFKPDWISIQYAGFGFNKRGLPFEFFSIKKVLPRHIKIHIMFHELWCGMAKTAGKKEKLLGFLQKMFIRRLVSVLKANAVSTSINSYAKRLEKLNIHASIVPIFGNIPLDIKADNAAWVSLVNEKGLDKINKEQSVVLGFFGSIYPCLGLTELLQNASDAVKKLNKNLVILSIGHGRGQKVQDLLNNLTDILIIETGSLPSALVNKVMQLVDLGIVTTPIDGINKSGGAIAWLERGVPALYANQDLSGDNDNLEEIGVFKVQNAGTINKALTRKPELKQESRLPETGVKYIKILSA